MVLDDVIAYLMCQKVNGKFMSVYFCHSDDGHQN
jgi:hypothetical protein